MIRLLDHPYLFTSEGRNIQDIEYRPGLTVGGITKDIRSRHEAVGFSEFYITVNGFEVHDLNKELIDEDFVAISIKHEFQAVMAVVWVALYNAGLYAAINVAAYVITTAIFIGAGLLLNSIMSPGFPDQPDSSVDKPSYGWAGMRNETEPGNPVPVAYGTPYSSPHIIGSYRLVENHDVWQYILACASAGKTNNILTADDIFIGPPPGEPLTSFTDYRFGATDGDIEITSATRAALADFAKVHHDRPFDRRISHDDRSSVKVVNLLRFNSLLSDGAIEDEVDGVPDWTKDGDVSIQSDTPKFGDGYLRLQNDAYISSDDFESLRLDTPGQIDIWVRFPDTNDRAILCKHYTNPITYAQSLMTFGYIDGNIFLQAISGEGSDIASVGTWGWTEDLLLSAAFTPTLGTWYYFRIQVAFISGKGSITHELKYGGTTLTTLDSDYVRTINNPDPEATSSEPVDYASQSSEQKARYHSYIGTGYYYDTASGILSILYGNCDLDEFRYSRGLPDSLTDTTVPISEFVDPVEVPKQLVITTLSEVDYVRLIFEFTQGLFKSTTSGLATMEVKIRTGYKLTTDSVYTYDTEIYSARKTSPCRFQKTITLPARGKYDICIERLTAEDPNDDSKQRSASFLTSFEEIIDIAQYYPGLQIISLAIKATETRSGSIDLIRVKHNRTMIDIPDLEGSSIGTVSRDASVPAYQMIDMFTNPYYGVIEDAANLDSVRFLEWASWTEEMVGSYSRAKSHIVFDEKWTFSDAINVIEQVGRARITRIGSIWSCVVDGPKTPSYSFSAGNILKDSAEWSSYEDLEKADVVEVAFWNDARRGQRDSRKAEASWFTTMGRLPKIAQVEIRGIIYADQALRQAQLMINKNEFITRHGKFRSFLRASLVELGDVVYVIPPTSKYLFGGMLPIDHTSENFITIDRLVNLSSSDYSGLLKLFIVSQDGTDSSFDVVGPWDEDTNILNISGSLTAERFSVWGLGRISQDRLLSQIVKKTVNPKDKNVTLEYCEYSDSVFYHSSVQSGLVAL